MIINPDLVRALLQTPRSVSVFWAVAAEEPKTPPASSTRAALASLRWQICFRINSTPPARISTNPARQKLSDLDTTQLFVGPDAYQKIAASKKWTPRRCNPPYFHPLHLEAAVGGAKHVYLEKPVAVDVPGAMKVIDIGNAPKVNSASMLGSRFAIVRRLSNLFVGFTPALSEKSSARSPLPHRLHRQAAVA